MINILSSNKDLNKILNLFFIVFFGFYLRIFISRYGHNFDYEMWVLNLDLYNNDKSIYNYGRYNYGPIWIWLLSFLDKINLQFISDLDFLRFKIIIFLSIVDFFIFILLFKKYNLKIASFFFLNPISIFITGYHNQFDNFAILIALYAFINFEQNQLILRNYKSLFCLFLLGLSLCTKHIMFLFPLWLAIGQKKFLDKIIVILIPYTIFLFSFVPYLNDINGILTNVFFYQSYNNAPIWNLIVPRAINDYIGKFILFTSTIIILGFYFRKNNINYKFLMYLICVVIFSSGIYNQYLAIPLVSIAILWNNYFLIYTLLTIFLFLGDGDALNINFFDFDWNLKFTRLVYHPILLFLLFGFLRINDKKNILLIKLKKLLKIVVFEIKNQFNLKN